MKTIDGIHYYQPFGTAMQYEKNYSFRLVFAAIMILATLAVFTSFACHVWAECQIYNQLTALR
jgi:hypothetical protein